MLEFDPAWYMSAYPQVASEIASGRWASAFDHYQQLGSQEGLSPNGLFDEVWYRNAYPDVRGAIQTGSVVSGYFHYCAGGNRDGRNPNSWFDETWYRRAYPEIGEAIQAGTLTCAYQHYLSNGAREGLAPNQFLWESWSPTRADTHVPDYSEWIEEAQTRRRRYTAKQEPSLISLVTPVHNTPIEFLRRLAASVIAQDFGAGTVFEWVLVDNGSTDQLVIEELLELTLHDFVRVFRSETNLGIMGGTRYAVRRARGRYVVPVDHDDLLYPDAVRIMTSFIQKRGYPPLLYSDEDKVEGSEFFEAYLKPAWDPVLFFHSCYIAHLCAIDRGLAAMLGAYQDDASRGCPDWDTFMRFFLAGYEPVHVPEVLYSWRRHAGSTAGNIDSKDYIHSSHRNTLQRFINASRHSERYSLEYSPLFNRTPDWRIVRQSDVAPRLTTLVLEARGQSVERRAFPSVVTVLDCDSTLCSMIAALQASRADTGLVRLVYSTAEPLYEDWFAESLNLLELFRDTVVVGGPVYDGADRILTAGMYFGFDGACGCPDRMRPRQDPGYFVQMWKPHSVSAVSAQHLVVDGAFLLDALSSGRIPEDVPLHCLGEWLGAVAARWGKRVVYSPFLAVRSETDWFNRRTQEEQIRFTEANQDLLPDTRFYSRHLGLSMDRAYVPVAPWQRSLRLPAPSPAAATGVGALL
jgi:glycosyltransferase involved in cell wall biosynthesis